MSDSGDRVYLFDTTLRDGAQTQGVDFTANDKHTIAKALDELGIDYVEGGWPGANPTDDTFFASPPKFKNSKFVAFGMTRRPGRSAANDPGVAPLLSAKVDANCFVGKTWDFHVETALNISLEENVEMVRDTMAAAVAAGKEAMFDAEHFFDGYQSNPQFAMDCLKAALEGGARWVVLCDTNGGTLPSKVSEILEQVLKVVPGENLGVHFHNDTDNAVANSLTAIEMGARQIQGTLGGLGERCGNANLISLIGSLKLKTDFEIGVSDEALSKLTSVSRLLDEVLNRHPLRNAPYVGDSAFAHKGGLHASAVNKDPTTYEHVSPDLVGNKRHVLVSDQAGKSNILSELKSLGIEIAPDDRKVTLLLEKVKELDQQGISFDGAEASFEIFARSVLGRVPDYYRLERFRVIDEVRWNSKGEQVVEAIAMVALEVGGQEHMEAAKGNGPVNALDEALRKALDRFYPELKDMELLDFKVRILDSSRGTRAVTRVVIESKDQQGRNWSTVGVSANIIDASYKALNEAITWKLLKEGVKPASV